MRAVQEIVNEINIELTEIERDLTRAAAGRHRASKSDVALAPCVTERLNRLIESLKGAVDDETMAVALFEAAELSLTPFWDGKVYMNRRELERLRTATVQLVGEPVAA